MKKIKLKIKILLHGFPPLKEEYIVDNYKLKKGIVDDLQINKSYDFDTSFYISSCTYRLDGDKNLYYNYFESIDYICFEIEDSKTEISELSEYILKQTDIPKQLLSIEKKLRLQFNVRIIFPMQRIDVYSEEDKFLCYLIEYKDFPKINTLDDINLKVFEHNSHHSFEMNSLEELEKRNVKFSKSMDYYYSSFDLLDLPSRYLILFASMEALLLKSNNKVTEKLSRRMSYILTHNDISKRQEKYEEIKKLYELRCEYIHGSKKDIISKANEEKLREYVREILIVYWIYVGNTNIGSKQFIKKIDAAESLGYGISLLTKYMRSDDYKETFKYCNEEILTGIKKGRFKITKINNGVVESVEEITK